MALVCDAGGCRSQWSVLRRNGANISFHCFRNNVARTKDPVPETSRVNSVPKAGHEAPPRTPLKCRIPQRLQPGRQKTGFVRKPTNADQLKTCCFHSNPRQASKFARPRSSEQPRPGSGNRAKEELSGRQAIMSRLGRTEVVAMSGTAKKSVIPKKTDNKAKSGQKKESLPDQETIKKYEELEVKAEYAHTPGDEEVKSTSVMQMKSCWRDKITLFEKMKEDLEEKQRAIMEVYATLRNTHKMMTTLGHQVTLPAADELRIMNVAKLSPDQLLQLCTGTRPAEDLQLLKGAVTIDMNKLYDMPTKLVATCEQTLIKRKEIIDWFETLKSEEKGISMNKLTKKINEFNAENEMLNCSLQSCKTEFLKELNEIVDYLRKGMNDAMALQVRTDELIVEISELNSQNTDLRKQLQAAEHIRSGTSKQKIEELEKELKEEKCKKMVMRDKLARAEGQVKIGTERASQLEASLELARSQNWTLERTVQQLHEQNQKLQMEFDKELNKLTESIKINTEHLDQIGKAREKLQAEKEVLEKRLLELADNNDISMKNMKEEILSLMRKLEEAERNFDSERADKKRLESKLESLCNQLLESEIRYKDLLKQLQDKDLQLNRAMSFKTDLKSAKQDLEVAKAEIETFKNRCQKQTEDTKAVEAKLREAEDIAASLSDDLKSKEDYIANLQNKEVLLQGQIKESEKKVASREDDINHLKGLITKLHEEFGEFDDMSQLLEMLNEQREKLAETIHKNEELIEAIDKKETDLMNQAERVSTLENVIEQRDNIIKMLTDKEEEHSNIIQLLRNNLEMRTQVDCDLSHQLAEKNAEIESLITNVDTRKQQISQLEKIILTLEDQLRKLHAQRRRDQEKMTYLEKVITEYETQLTEPKRPTEAPADNLNHLIKILEDELNNLEPKNYEFKASKKVIDDQKRKEQLDGQCFETNNTQINQVVHDKPSAKVVVGNLIRRSSKSNDERDSFERKKIITNIDAQKWLTQSEQPTGIYPSSQECYFQPSRGIVPVASPISRNLRFLMNSSPKDEEKKNFLVGAQRDEEKKCKMYKIASHKV